MDASRYGQTLAMRGRPARGALIGVGIGLGLVLLLIVMPRAIEGDYYEVTDPLVFMGVPLLIVCAALGAVVGAPASRAPAVSQQGQVQEPRRAARAVLAVVAGIAISLAGWLFLWATGAVGATPLWLW